MQLSLLLSLDKAIAIHKALQSLGQTCAQSLMMLDQHEEAVFDTEMESKFKKIWKKFRL